MSTPSLPVLPDDVILIRLKPDDPAWLVRASLAYKHWRSFLTDAGFLRHYRESHRTLPRLGLFHNESGYRSYVARFVPTCSFGPAAVERRGCCCIDVRHSRVLIQTIPYTGLIVWDPVTDKQWEVPQVPGSMNFNAMVLCAAPGCDHLDCHGGPFAVALVSCSQAYVATTCAYLYSSESGEWSDQAELEGAFYYMYRWPGILVGDAVYFSCKSTLRLSSCIVKYDMGRGELSVMNLPPLHQDQLMGANHGAMLTATDDKLGFVSVDGSTLCLWSQEPTDPGGWAQRRVVVEPETAPAPARLHVKGLAPAAGEIFVDAGGVMYSVELEAGRAKKESDEFASLAGAFTVYKSFWTPDRVTPTCYAKKKESITQPDAKKKKINPGALGSYGCFI